MYPNSETPEQHQDIKIENTMKEITADFVIVGGTSPPSLPSSLPYSLSPSLLPLTDLSILLQAVYWASSLPRVSPPHHQNLASSSSKPGPTPRLHKYRNQSHRHMLPFISPKLDHGYLTVPQEGLVRRRLPYLRGKGLGGSTLTNFMIYLSGAKDDYDRWAELTEDDAWKWENFHRRLKEGSWHNPLGMGTS